MTGMKEGAGEDPFAEDDGSAAESRGGPAGSEPERAERGESEATSVERADEPETRSMRIPYKLRRDGVQDGRDRVPLFLQPDTKSAERDALHELEERFEGNVSLTDLREAVVKAGLAHVDEVEAQLEEWGYGMTFDE